MIIPRFLQEEYTTSPLRALILRCCRVSPSNCQVWSVSSVKWKAPLVLSIFGHRNGVLKSPALFQGKELQVTRFEIMRFYFKSLVVFNNMDSLKRGARVEKSSKTHRVVADGFPPGTGKKKKLHVI